jgi:hypothetical protein
MLKLKACPKCGGDLEWLKDDREWLCLQGGHRFDEFSKVGLLLTPIPPKPSRAGKGKNRNYYEQNKPRILREREILGEPAVKRRWKMKHCVWTGLKHRWGLPVHKWGTNRNPPLTTPLKIR